MQGIPERIRELSALDRLRYHEIADAFDESWHGCPEAPPDIESFLPPDEPIRRLVLVELAKIDLACRLSRREPVIAESYFQRFTEFDSDDGAAIELICTEFEAQRSSTPTVGDYCARFPRYTVQLRPRLEKRGVFRPWAPPSPYVDLQDVAQTSMSIVYVATDENLQRKVALKVMSPALANRDDCIRRFQSEAELLAAFDHPNIVKVFAIGEHAGLPFFAMEYCPGGNLRTHIASGPLEPRLAAECVAQVSDAVQTLHEKQGIHRDLKPSNILLTANGTPKLADFGLAKRLGQFSLTDTDAFVGTLVYTAPEQSQNSKKVTSSADIYSLGAILYECLTQRPPVPGANTQESSQRRSDKSARTGAFRTT